MKKTTQKLLGIAFIMLSHIITAQVGVGTTTPKAALDVNGGTNNYGFLMPRVALTASNVAAPVTNPAGGVLEVGTMVFNTATTAGTYGVIPGIYFWDGTNWISQVHRYYDNKFVQTSDLQTKSSDSFINIPGLTANNFIAPYTGKYSITFTGYLGAGTVDVNSAKVGYVEGNFKLTVNGTDYKKYTHSSSFYNSDSLTDYLELFNESNITITVSLTAGQTCTLNASYDGENDDNITESSPHIIGRSTALGNYCEIKVMYIGR